MSAHSILSVGANHKSIFLSKMSLLIEQRPQTTLSWVGMCCVIGGVERRNQGRKESVMDRRKDSATGGRQESIMGGRKGVSDGKKEPMMRGRNQLRMLRISIVKGMNQ